MKKKALFMSLVLASMSLVACGGGGGTSYTVTFDTQGGSEIAPVKVNEGKLVKEPTAPTKTDAVKGDIKFFAWYNGETLWSFKLNKVTKDITLTARWLEKYTVTFDDVADPAKATQYIHRGETISKPSDPAAPSGKTFYGWQAKNNGGQVWDFDNERLNKVMQDLQFAPLFVDSTLQNQPLEAELCPNILEMDGATYSGGASRRQMIYQDPKHALGSSGSYYWDEDYAANYADESTNPNIVFGAAVYHLNVRGNHLDWNFTSSAAATNVTLFMRLSAEYSLASGHPDGELVLSFKDDEFIIKVNNVAVEYGEIVMHNVCKTGTNDLLPFQDYMLSINVSLLAGDNKIEMISDNNNMDSGTLQTASPVVDCLKVYSSSTLTWGEANLSVVDKEI